MNIVFEGPDNAGKSTMAEYVSRTLGMPLRYSGGRETVPGEINVRAEEFMKLDGYVFDRHPVVSQEIYRQIHHGTCVRPILIDRFYRSATLLICCVSPIDEGLDGQIIKDYDKPEHQKQIQDHYQRIRRLYDEWAINRAHIIARKYGNYQLLTDLIKGAIQ